MVGLIPVASMISPAIAGPIPYMYLSAISIRLCPGMSTPMILAILKSFVSALTLFMARIGAHHANDALASNDAAMLAKFFY